MIKKFFLLIILVVLNISIFSCANQKNMSQNSVDEYLDYVDATHLDKYNIIFSGDKIDDSINLKINVEKNKKIIFRAISRYSKEMSYITFESSLYKSPKFCLGSQIFVEQSWRFPPCLTTDFINISIDSFNSNLEIVKLVFYYEDDNDIDNLFDSSISFNSHLGFSQMCPENTYSAVEMSGMLGYKSCIVVPKMTCDGELVCIHDDLINRTARFNDLEVNGPIYVNNLTYEDLYKYDFGFYKNEFWRNEKILKIDDFFSICKKYNMSPIFSTHPNLSYNCWEKVKEMLIKYDLLDKFIIKSFDVNILTQAYDIFGEDIYGYTGDNFSIEQMKSFVQDNSIDKSKVELVIETNVEYLTKNLIDSIISNAFLAHAFTINSDFSEIEIRKYIEWGITGFTDDTYCQNGMMFLNF